MTMNTPDSKPHWLEVAQPDLLGALRQLAALPKPSRMPQKLILTLEGDELEISTGVTSIRVPAKGEWPLPALLSYKLLSAFMAHVERGDTEAPIRLEGGDSSLKVGASSLACHFKDARTAVASAMKTERKAQKADDPGPHKRGRDYREPTDQQRITETIQTIYPDCIVENHAHSTLIGVPSMPNFLLRLTDYHAELRITNGIAGKHLENAYERSRVWKRLEYPIVATMGFQQLIREAGRVASEDV